MKNIIKKIISIILIMILVSYSLKLIIPSISIAATKSELQNESSQTKKEIENKKDEINEIKEEISSELEAAKKITTQITEYETEISQLDAQIKNLEEKIKESEANIVIQEEEYKKQKKLLDEKVVAMAENGETTYLDVLLSSASLSEMISNYYLVSEVVDYDLNTMEEIQNKKKKIEEQKNEMELNKTQVANAKETVESKKDQLKVAKAQKEATISKLTNEEKEAQKQLEQYQADQREIEKELERIAEEERKVAASSGNSGSTVAQITGNPSSSGYIFPIAGKSKTSITTGYGRYSWGGVHSGVDVAISAGTPIYAVKDGTVIISTALKNANGTYRSYGEYIAISHGDGTVTFYCHGLAGSRLVSVNQKVKQGQQIMSVGSTGNSTGNHLHFEVRVNNKAVNPIPYLP